MKNATKKIAMVSSVITLRSGVVTYTKIGFSNDFFHQWLTSFLTFIFVMMPIFAIVMTVVNKGVQARFEHRSSTQQNIIFGLCMAPIMAGVMAVSTTLNNTGLVDLNSFIQAWLVNFFTALPIDIVIAIALSVFIKPKVKSYLAS